MPIKRAAYKAMRADRGKRSRNLNTISELRTVVRKFNDLVLHNKLDEARAALKTASSKLYKAVHKGALHKNTAARKVSRLSKKLVSAQKTAAGKSA